MLQATLNTGEQNQHARVRESVYVCVWGEGERMSV